MFCILLFLFLIFPLESAQTNIFDISFESALTTTIQFGYNPNDKNWFEFIKQLYVKNNVIQFASDILKIPRIIHQIWLGGPVPNEFKDYMDSWKRVHPDWIYILWTDNEIETFDLYNKELYNQASNYGQRSDIWRYEILYRFGGLYADVDFYCLKSFDPLHLNYTFYTGIGTSTVALLNGLIGSMPGHPILKHIIENLKNIKIKSFNDIMQATGPYYFTKCFMEVAIQCEDPIIVLPHTFFYPSPNIYRYHSFKEQNDFIKPESFTIHYWACSWQRKTAEVLSKR